MQLFGRFASRIKPSLKQNPLDYNGNPNRIHISIPELDCGGEYISRLAPELLIDGRVSLLHHERPLSFTEELLTSESPLWKYNLYYFEFAIGLAANFFKTGDSAYILTLDKALSDFISAGVRPKPYVASLRIVNLLVVADLIWDYVEPELIMKIYGCVYRDYCFLKDNAESYLLGNHYFENLKSLCIASYAFGEKKDQNKHLRMFEKQVKEQFLPDGMHFELSPMYHNILLEGLIRTTLGMKQNGDSPEWLYITLQNALSAASTLCCGLERVPLFNDSGNNVAKPFPLLLSAAEKTLGQKPDQMDRLVYAGYYRIDDGPLTLLFDCGIVGPDYMPGHGHCDCMSFELFNGGKPLFVNSGTYQYQGDKRSYFRSTRAHNTVMIDNHEQSECWGEHRVARRIHGIQAQKNEHLISGEYKNFLGEKHTRNLSLADGVLTVLDSTEALKKSIVHSYLHIAPGYRIELQDSIVTISHNENAVCEIRAIECTPTIYTSGELCMYSPEFGLMMEAACVVFIWESDAGQHGYIIRVM